MAKLRKKLIKKTIQVKTVEIYDKHIISGVKKVLSNNVDLLENGERIDVNGVEDLITEFFNNYQQTYKEIIIKSVEKFNEELEKNLENATSVKISILHPNHQYYRMNKNTNKIEFNAVVVKRETAEELAIRIEKEKKRKEREKLEEARRVKRRLLYIKQEKEDKEKENLIANSKKCGPLTACEKTMLSRLIKKNEAANKPEKVVAKRKKKRTKKV